MSNLTTPGTPEQSFETVRAIFTNNAYQVPEAATTAVRARVKGVKGYVNVSRPTRWGNMYTVAEYGNEGACRLYRTWLEFQWRANQNGFRDAIKALKGRTLGCCGCTDEQIAAGHCHAAVLAKFVDAKFPTYIPVPASQTVESLHDRYETRDEAGEARAAIAAMGSGEGVGL